MTPKLFAFWRQPRSGNNYPIVLGGSVTVIASKEELLAKGGIEISQTGILLDGVRWGWCGAGYLGRDLYSWDGKPSEFWQQAWNEEVIQQVMES